MGSDQQELHDLAGLIEYVGGIGGLYVIYFGIRKNVGGPLSIVTLSAAVIATVGFVIMATPDFNAVRGAAPRLADYSMFAWLTYAVLGDRRSSEISPSQIH